MRINPFLKVAMRQLKGIELQHSDTNLELTLLSRFSWLRVSLTFPPLCWQIHDDLICLWTNWHTFCAWLQLQERYPLSCQPVTIKRRDFRGGQHLHAVAVFP